MNFIYGALGRDWRHTYNKNNEQESKGPVHPQGKLVPKLHAAFLSAMRMNFFYFDISTSAIPLKP